jgi:NIPSNAP
VPAKAKDWYHDGQSHISGSIPHDKRAARRQSCHSSYGAIMIFDLRIYTFKPGMQNAWLAMYEKHAYPIQLRYLGKPVVFTTTEVGPLNQVVHLWAYADQAERERKRDAMQQDPQWQVYLKMNTEAGYMAHMENRILRSTSFSPL